MIGVALEIAFIEKTVVFWDKPFRTNYVMKAYSPEVARLELEAPVPTLPAYIFLHANVKISDLEISGEFGEATETGLVWNQPEIRIFNVMLEMTAGPNATFAIVRWAQRVILFSSYIDVEMAVINLDSFVYFSITQSSLVGAYLQHQGIPYSKMIRSDAFFTGNERLDTIPRAYEEPCNDCFLAASGRGCTECMSSTFHDDQLTCKCQYHNYEYSDYQNECEGTPEPGKVLVNESIEDIKEYYFFPCTNNFAYSVDYYANIGSGTRISFFRDDECGLNNILLTGKISTVSSTQLVNEIAGVVFVKTTDMANTTIRLNVTNADNRLLSICAFARNATGNITLENLDISGAVYEQWTESSTLTYIRTCGLFHYIEGVTLTINGLMMHDIEIFSYYSGVYNSIGIGVAKNCTLHFSNIYIGDTPPNEENPLLTFDTEQDYEPDVDCGDKMDKYMINELMLRDSMLREMVSKISYVRSDSHDLGGLLGLLEGSSLNLDRALLAVKFERYFSTEKCGLLATVVNNSEVRVSLSAMHMYSDAYSPNAAIAKVIGAASQLRISASFNMSATNPQSGFVAFFERGVMSIAVYLDLMLSGGKCAGIAGTFSDGQINLSAAFGKVQFGGQYSGNELGYWTGGRFNDQVCEDPPCKLDPPNSSYINIKSVDGVCSPEVQGSEPIGSPGKLYFEECKENAKIRVRWAGPVPDGSLTIFNPDEECDLVGITVTGSLNLQIGYNFNYGCVNEKETNSSNVEIDLELILTGQRLTRVGFVCATNNIGDLYNTIIRGNITSQVQQQNGYIGGAIGYASQDHTINGLAVYGLELQIEAVQFLSLVTGEEYWRCNYYNIIVDDYSKTRGIPDFQALPQTLPADFRCSNKVQDADMKKSLYLRNLLTNNAPSRRSSIKIGYSSTYIGGLCARPYDVSFVENVSFLIEYDVETYSSFAGGMFGYMAYTMTISHTYIDVVAYKNYGCVFAYISSQINFELAVKFVANGQYSGILGNCYASYNLKLSVDIVLNEVSTAGIAYEMYGWGNVQKVYGSVTKNCQQCYNIYYYPETDASSNMFITNSATCPNWT